MRILTTEHVQAAMQFPLLLDALYAAFSQKFTMPPRTVFLLDEQHQQKDAFALLPAWNDEFIGVKAFTYFPEPQPNYQRLYSKIMLFDRVHGEPLALIDGTSVTMWRTAGISALASRLLSRDTAQNLLIIGTGNLASYLIHAHICARPLKRIMVWGRSGDKSAAIVEDMRKNYSAIQFEVVTSIETACVDADIVVCATGSEEPLVEGAWIKPGTHTDFIGNHHATKRECDTALVVKAKVYVDSKANCFKEAGEILVPIAEGACNESHVIGELADICTGVVPKRINDNEITLFKSVGMALGDLVGAGLVYKATPA